MAIASFKLAATEQNSPSSHHGFSHAAREVGVVERDTNDARWRAYLDISKYLNKFAAWRAGRQLLESLGLLKIQPDMEAEGRPEFEPLNAHAGTSPAPK